MKLIKKEFNNNVLTAQRLKGKRVNLEMFKLSKILLPVASVFISQKNSPDLYTIAFSVLSQKCSPVHFEELQDLLLSTLLDDSLEPIHDVDTYLDDKGIQSLDVVYWLFCSQLLSTLTETEVYKSLSVHIEDIKETFFPSVAPTPEE